DSYIQKTRFESVYIDTTIKPIQGAKSILLNQSYHVNRFISKEFANKLVEILRKEKFDIIQLESIFVAPYIDLIRKHSKAKIVLRTHNVEHKIWGRFMIHQKSPVKRWILKKMIRQLRRYELGVFNKIDAFLAISLPDYNFFHKRFPQLKGDLIPVGIDIDRYPVENEYIPTDNPKLFHIGSMNWIPNQEGLTWFFEEVWPLVHTDYPKLTFNLAGRSISKKWYATPAPNLIVDGEVEDANQYILSKDIMIVPLLSGSGVRIKILEGMALGRTVITTPIGAEGLDVENGDNIFIADTPQDFADLIDKCVNNPELCKIIGENAREYIILKHNNEIITKKIISLYEGL
ncbi:glycosyltransferase family 4 protein, partial [Bacteroidales bacterium OttesenSCG-928-E04]|nr:glycosyltransferase family 4 protein [Bacteroidales bacterium OttesenSCG-928-E04]